MRKFNTVINGYDKNEVNAFISEVTIEYEKMLNKLKSRAKEVTMLQERINHYKNIETTLNKAVLIAEDSSNQIKKIAKDEAKSIVDDAKKNASHIINDALIEAEKINLEVDRLRRNLKVYKARIKQTIEEQLTMVDDIDDIPSDYRG